MFAQVISKRIPERKSQRRIRTPSAPRVDSALLRFLSTQKIQREARLPSTMERDMMQAHDELQKLEEQRKLIWSPTDRYLDTLRISLLTNGVIPTMGQTRQYLDTLTPRQIEPVPAIRKLALRAFDTTDSWMGQYNSNRVAQLLLSHGVDEHDAMEAGVSVQSHVLARTARRRVREFLKRRDKMWVNPQNRTLLEIPTASSSTTSLEYGFEDVVNLLLDFGLTGRDIAAILEHTPSIALMRPRRRVDATVSKGCDGGETLEETIKRAFEGVLCDSLQLRKYDARKVSETTLQSKLKISLF